MLTFPKEHLIKATYKSDVIAFFACKHSCIFHWASLLPANATLLALAVNEGAERHNSRLVHLVGFCGSFRFIHYITPLKKPKHGNLHITSLGLNFKFYYCEGIHLFTFLRLLTSLA